MTNDIIIRPVGHADLAEINAICSSDIEILKETGSFATVICL